MPNYLILFIFQPFYFIIKVGDKYMIDTLKFHSNTLNIDVRVKIFLPSNYDQNDKLYNSVYIISKNDHINSEELNKSFENNDLIGIQIYPNNDIDKNVLLFDSFESKYNFSKLYSDFLFKEILTYLEKRYRLGTTQKDRAILGYDITALFALTSAYEYNLFSKMISLNLDIEKFKFRFFSYLKSKFDPNTGLYLYMKNEETLDEIYKLEKMFGLPVFEKLESNQIKDAIDSI